MLVTCAGMLAGCAGVPDSSSPQAIGTVEQPTRSSLPEPTRDMEPDVLLHEFLKATSDPADRHLAARQFLTEAASNAWDDAGSAILIDRVVFTETRSATRVSVTMKADILGSLSDLGVFETAEGALPDPGPIELAKTSDGWRIDKLPNGVFLDWKQFQQTYKRHPLYFVDPTGKTTVPDPRYLAVSDPNQLATELVSKLITGPRPELARSVRNLLAAPVRLLGPVTRADGGGTSVGQGYGGAKIQLDGLQNLDPQSRALLAAQLVWTLSRSDIKGPYVITADGLPLDERFADGWEPADVASTDPGAADGAAAGLYALIGGSLVALDRNIATKVSGAFGSMGDQVSATLARDGHGVASVVAVRLGAPDMASSLWVGNKGQDAVKATEGRSITRPSWALDGAVWVVVDGNNVLRVTQEVATGQPASVAVDAVAVTTAFPGVITDLQLSRDATRAALVIDGQVVLSRVEQTPTGQFALTGPRRLGFGLGNSAVSLAWRTGDDMVVSRNDPVHPVSYVNLDGVNSDGPVRGLSLPVGTVAASPSTVYVADQRGVMQLSGSGAGNDQVWADVPAFMVPGAVPVLPG